MKNRRQRPIVRIGQRVKTTRTFTITDDPPRPEVVDLSDAETVRINVEHVSRAFTAVSWEECEVVGDGSDGEVEYTFTKSDTTTLHGHYYLQFDVEYEDEEDDLYPPDGYEWLIAIGRRQSSQPTPLEVPKVWADEAVFGSLQVDEVSIGEVIDDPNIGNLSVDALDVDEATFHSLVDGIISADSPLDGTLDGPGLTIDDGDLAVTLDIEDIEGLSNPLQEHVNANDYDIESIRNLGARSIDVETLWTPYQIVEVDNFGAVGNGEDDDTDAFVDAIEYIEDELGQGLLSGSAGAEYLVDPESVPRIDPEHVKGISLNNAAVYLTSDATLFDIEGSASGSSDPDDTSDQVRFDEMNCYVENGRFFGDGEYHGTAVRFENSFGAHVRGCQMTGLENGIVLEGYNRNSFVMYNSIWDNAGNGIWYKDGDHHQSNIVGNHIMACDSLMYITGMGALTDVQIVGNDFETFDSNEVPEPRGGVIAEDNSEVTGLQIVGNTFDDHLDIVDAMIDIDGDADQITVVGNQNTFTSAPFIRMSGVFEAKCAFNTTKRLDGAPVYEFKGCEEVALVGNGAHNVEEEMFVIDDCQQVTATANVGRRVDGSLISATDTWELSIGSNVGRDIGGPMFDLDSISRLSLIGNTGRGVSGPLVGITRLFGASIVGNGGNEINGPMIEAVDATRFSAMANNGRRIEGPLIKLEDSDVFGVAFNGGLEVDGALIELTEPSNGAVAYNTGEEVEDYLIRLMGNARGVDVSNNMSRYGAGLVEVDGNDEYTEGLSITENRIYETEETLDTALIYVHDTRLFGSAIDQNYLRPHGAGIWAIDVSSTIEYFSGSSIMGNKINGSSGDGDNGLRLDADDYVASLVKNNTVRDAEEAFDLPESEEDTLIVNDNLSGTGLR